MASVYEQTLYDRGYIKLPPGSFFTWIEREWLDKFSPFLVYKHNAWIPRLKYLTDINNLYTQYQEFILTKLNKELSLKHLESDQLF